MKSINIVYSELYDLKTSITILKEQANVIDKEFNTILEEVRTTVFNASEGTKLYKNIQEFLQERRLLKTQMEELQVQYELLGGDIKLNQLEKYQNFKNVPKKDKKYHRKADYFKNFREDIKEEVSEMYHITK